MLFNINDLDSSFPSVVFSLLQEFEDVFLEDGPSSLPLEETKAFNAKWRNLIVHVLYMYYLYPKMMVNGGCVFIFVPSTTLSLRFKGGMMRIKTKMIRFKCRLGQSQDEGPQSFKRLSMDL